MGFEFSMGGDDVGAELRALIVRKREAARRAVARAAALVEDQVKAELSRSSHRRGTRTPSRPGSPPSLISGTLRRSVRHTPPRPIPRGWEATIGPTAEYSRIQELGGTVTARSGGLLRFRLDGRTIMTPRVTLPARPYVRPGARRANPAVREIFREEWSG